jgi:tripartite-type tricarboxylate transporter receptor subunit TctC
MAMSTSSVFGLLRRFMPVVLAATTVLATLPGNAQAQPYPSRPIRIIVPAAPGGALDTIARLLAQKVAELWKHQLYIENRPGANWIIGMDAVAKSPADGYTLLFVASSGLTVNPYVFPNMPLDPLRDLTPVTIATDTAFVLLLNSAVPAHNVPDFIAHLRGNPGKLNHASNSATTMLASELFKMHANVDYIDVNYRGASQAIVATHGGTTEFCFVDLGSATAAIEGKTLRPLALTAPTRYELNPDIPTLAEQGLPGYSVLSMTVMLAPAGVPGEIIAKLNAAFQQALESPDVAAKLRSIGQAVKGGTSEEAAEALRSEARQWERLIKDRNIQFGR